LNNLLRILITSFIPIPAVELGAANLDEIGLGYGDPDELTGKEGLGYGDVPPAAPRDDLGYGDAGADDANMGYGEDLGYNSDTPEPPKRSQGVRRRCSVTKYSLEAQAQQNVEAAEQKAQQSQESSENSSYYSDSD